jgi:hypothetical protein
MAVGTEDIFKTKQIVGEYGGEGVRVEHSTQCMRAEGRWGGGGGREGVEYYTQYMYTECFRMQGGGDMINKQGARVLTGWKFVQVSEVG